MATLHRVFRRLDRQEFERVLGERMRQNGLDESEAIAVDGKSLSRIHGERVRGVHLVSAFSHQSGVVAGDTQFTQRRDCETIVSKGGLLFRSQGEPEESARRHRSSMVGQRTAIV